MMSLPTAAHYCDLPKNVCLAACDASSVLVGGEEMLRKKVLDDWMASLPVASNGNDAEAGVVRDDKGQP